MVQRRDGKSVIKLKRFWTLAPYWKAFIHECA